MLLVVRTFQRGLKSNNILYIMQLSNLFETDFVTINVLSSHVTCGQLVTAREQ